jgi:hypothetical protein
MALAVASSAFAAPNVTNATQKGSLLVFPDIRVDSLGVEGVWDTLIRISNDGASDIDIWCYWMDGNKNRVDFVIPVTKNQPIWFNAFSGEGSVQVNRFPATPSNGFDNPHLISPGAVMEAGTTITSGGDDSPTPFFKAPYLKGLLACWAVDGGGTEQVKWNHLSGTATVYNTGAGIGAYEYNAYAFFVPSGVDQEPVGVAGALNLNGVEYDSCPLYQIGQFTPVNVELPADQRPTEEPVYDPGKEPLLVWGNRLAIVGCNLNLQQDWTAVITKLQFEVWNEDEVKFTGAFECADSWHETTFAPPSLFQPAGSADASEVVSLGGGPLDSAAQNFQYNTLGTFSARYRVQGIKSTQCPNSVQVGVIAVQSTSVSNTNHRYDFDMVGTTLAAAGKFPGRIVWDPQGVVPEGGIR